MKKVALAVILICFSNYLIAQEVAPDQEGWIVGAGAGSALLSIEPVRQYGVVSSEVNTSLLNIYSGFNFTNWFGIEFDLSKSSDFNDENTNQDAYVLGMSVTPKFTHRLNNNLDIYFKAGLQYLAYEQSVYSNYESSITWNGIDTFFGAGLQYSFDSRMRVRIDYKYSNVNLERTENTYGFYIYDEEIDLTYRALTFTANYQF